MFEAENSLREVNEKCPLHVISFLYYLTVTDPELEIRGGGVGLVSKKIFFGPSGLTLV